LAATQTGGALALSKTCRLTEGKIGQGEKICTSGPCLPSAVLGEVLQNKVANANHNGPGPGPGAILATGAPSIGRIIDEPYAKHEPIHDMFYKRVGGELMYEESQLAEEIMLQMAERGVAVLPVYDSFLVVRSWADTGGGIDDLMQKVFEERYKVKCRIWFDKTEFAARAKEETKYNKYGKFDVLTYEQEVGGQYRVFSDLSTRQRILEVTGINRNRLYSLAFS